MALGIIIATLLGRATPEMGAFGLAGTIDGPHRAISQTRYAGQPIGQHRVGLLDQGRHHVA